MKKVILFLSGFILFFAPFAKAETITPFNVGPKLIQATGNFAVYFLAENGKRYVFPNESAYNTWKDVLGEITVVNEIDLAKYKLGGIIMHRPGARMVKIQTDDKVYAVDKNRTLRWIKSEKIARDLYGKNWASKIDDMPDTLFSNYKIGKSIIELSDYNPDSAILSANSIGEEIAY